MLFTCKFLITSLEWSHRGDEMKKLIYSLLSVFVLIGCSTPQASIQSSTKEESLTEQYTDLEDDSAFVVMEKDNVKTFIEHGTGILYFSFPECPWCQAYIPMLSDVLNENDMQANYYNVRVDRTNDHDFYEEIANLLITHNQSGKEDIVQYDNDGNPLIYMPLTLFIDGGKIIDFNGETNAEDSDVIKPEQYWTQEKRDSLKATLSSAIQTIKEAQLSNSSKGCDNENSGCSYGG